MPRFTWIPVYRDIAQRILEYEGNQNGLIALIIELQSRGLPTISLRDRDTQDREVPLKEIDPFTFFATWNRGVSDVRRTEIITELQKLLKTPVNPPQDYAGIPLVSNMQSWFFPYSKERRSEDIPLLWRLFREALNNDINPRTFDAVLKIKYVKYNITMGLFWIDPERYLNLDHVNRVYLRSKNVNADSLDDYSSYTRYMNETRGAFGRPFYEISLDAWQSSHVGRPDSEEHVPQRYWLYAPGQNAEYWREFYSAGLLAIGWDELGDLSQYQSKESIARVLRESASDPAARRTNSAMSCFAFAHRMSVGDIVFAKKGRSRIVGWGIVRSAYYFDESRKRYKHVRKMDWRGSGEWTMPQDKRFVVKTLTDITGDPDLVSYLSELVGQTAEGPAVSTATQAPQYWWLNANPKIWSLAEQPVGGHQTYTARNEQGNKRRIYRYFQEVKPGDIVVGYVGSPNMEIVGEAVITRGLHLTEGQGEIIEFQKTASFVNPVPYHKVRQLPELRSAEPIVNHQGSLFRLTGEEYEAIRGLIDDANPLPGPESQIPAYTREQALSEIFMDAEMLDRAIALLISKKSIVLQGPPGVGKTFFARRLAWAALGKKDNSKMQMIQFHQSYSYEDFVQGYRPNMEGHFDLKSGVFYAFCRQAQLDENGKYFFVIDEINRGNLSKIFGEVMMLIEYDKRGRDFAIPLIYAHGPEDKFFVPENLFFIGTMNTADRSLAMVDYALRRRFCFIDMKPAFERDDYQEYLSRLGADASLIREITDKMTELNDRIGRDKDLGNGFKIGHSYFCPPMGVAPNRSWFRHVITGEIEPLLKEYWFDNPSEAENATRKLLS